ncbi:39S ribosomal protein L14, mitochondrial [Trachymyrmex cornetzi]|uniref:39S ribosomal protein L14, mitochondrial n=1 Tax=Trachymyrmex cornetzi TaxID=471704 RepID=A0A151IRL6_9HYME|nr:39S ribosomal protein L14, mitochondrial [Trachymyrmex cornetzi]
MEDRPPRCIHVYNKQGIGYIVEKGYIGLKQQQVSKVSKFDSNNLVLVDDNGIPLGTRIQVPIPRILRMKMKETRSKGTDYTKLIAITSRFV